MGFGWPSSLTTYHNNTRFFHSNQWSTYRKIPRVWALGFLQGWLCIYQYMVLWKAVDGSEIQNNHLGCRKPCNSWVNWWVNAGFLVAINRKYTSLPRQTQSSGMCNLPPTKTPPSSSPSKGSTLRLDFKGLTWPDGNQNPRKTHQFLFLVA